MFAAALEPLPERVQLLLVRLDGAPGVRHGPEIAIFLSRQSPDRDPPSGSPAAASRLERNRKRGGGAAIETADAILTKGNSYIVNGGRHFY